MLDKFRDYRTAVELSQPQYQLWRSLNEVQRRSRVLVGVIDDSPFPYKQNLENLGYRISFLGDPNLVSVVEPCHIVLCDLQGVARALDPKRQGAFFIDEIKRNYPEKYVVAYTGGGLNLNISREALISADMFLRKDAVIDEWRERLDGIVSKLLDPAAVWMRQRRALVERGIDTLTILRIEDAFVSSITLRQSQDSSNLSRYLESGRVSGDVRAVVQSMIASGLYNLLIGN